MRAIPKGARSEPHTIGVRVYTGDGRHRDIAWNPETAPILRQCTKQDGVYNMPWQGAMRDTILRNEIK